MDARQKLENTFAQALAAFHTDVLRENARPVGSPPLRELKPYEYNPRDGAVPREYLVYYMECRHTTRMCNVGGMTVKDAATVLANVPTEEKQYGFGPWTAHMRKDVLPSIIAKFHAVGVKPYFVTNAIVSVDAQDAACVEITCTVRCYFPVVAAAQ